MITNNLRLPTQTSYRRILAAQGPIWIAAGLVWGGLMTKAADFPLFCCTCCRPDLGDF